MLKFYPIYRFLLIFAIFCTTTLLAAPQSNIPKGMVNPLAAPYSAPAIEGIDSWINATPLNLQKLTGKIILISFWNDGCLDCINSLPYLKSWYDKYKNNNFILIGIHSPEFSFQQNLSNVQQAITQYGIKFPIALDNRLITWHHFKNQKWPTFYLINKDGNVIYKQDSVTESDYINTENNIRTLLGMLPNIKAKEPVETVALDQTPNIFVGYANAKNYAGVEDIQKDKEIMYTFPQRLMQNQWALQGTWQVNANNAIAMATDAKLILYFKANKAFALMGAPGKAVRVLVRITQSDNTASEKQVYVTGTKLYSLFDSKTSASGMLELTPDTSGLEIYSINFSN